MGHLDGPNARPQQGGGVKTVSRTKSAVKLDNLVTDFTLRTHPISTKGPTLFQVVPFVF